VITGREPNIVACMGPVEQAKALAAERRAIARNEIAEQKKFYGWLRKERKAGRLYFLWPRSDKATTIQVGHPDFTVWLPNGRTLLMEFKAPGGKRSPAQEEASTLLDSLGHPVLLIYSAEQAQAIVELTITFQHEQPNRKQNTI
jgi:VRR-NUC domain